MSGKRYTEEFKRDFLDQPKLQQSMSQVRERHDNAVADSFCPLLKRE